MSRNSPSAFQRESNWLGQLLTALVSGSRSESDIGRLITDAWLRLGGAVAASLIRPIQPGLLQITRSTRDATGEIRTEERQARESCSSLLDAETVEHLAAIAPRQAAPLVQMWPDLLACLVVETGDEEPVGSAALQLDSELLIQLSRRLLGSMSTLPLVFPGADQLAAMAEFSAGAGHEINNPLASILGQTQLLLRSEHSIDRQQALETIGAQAWRIRDMIGNAMLFARPPALQLSAVELVGAVRDAVERTAANSVSPDIVVEFRTSETHLPAKLDSTQLPVLVSILVRNAIEAIQSVQNAGTVSVLLKGARGGTVAELVVRDSGPGVHDADILRHMFDPFFSGRQAGRGLGFGLCLAARIVQQHSGLILYHEPGPQGAEFHVALPLQPPAERRIQS